MSGGRARALAQIDSKKDGVEPSFLHAWQINSPATISEIMALANVKVATQQPYWCIDMRIDRHDMLMDPC